MLPIGLIGPSISSRAYTYLTGRQRGPSTARQSGPCRPEPKKSPGQDRAQVGLNWVGPRASMALGQIANYSYTQPNRAIIIMPVCRSDTILVDLHRASVLGLTSNCWKLSSLNFQFRHGYPDQTSMHVRVSLRQGNDGAILPCHVREG